MSFSLNYFDYLFFSKFIINGQAIKVPKVHKINLADFLTEKWLNDIIKKILTKKSGAFIDVGYNLGQTLVKVKSLKLNHQYYGFEPNPTCYYFTNELIKANKFQGCTLVPIGLSNISGIMNLFARAHSDSACLVPDFKDSIFYSINQFVPVFAGDYLVNYFGIEAISIIKIDVEGGELEVIQGLKNTISKLRPYILCEILPVGNENDTIGRLKKERQEALLSILREQRYGICRILRNGDTVFLNTIEVHSDMSLRDYLFIPEEEKNEAARLLNIEDSEALYEKCLGI